MFWTVPVLSAHLPFIVASVAFVNFYPVHCLWLNLLSGLMGCGGVSVSFAPFLDPYAGNWGEVTKQKSTCIVPLLWRWCYAIGPAWLNKFLWVTELTLLSSFEDVLFVFLSSTFMDKSQVNWPWLVFTCICLYMLHNFASCSRHLRKAPVLTTKTTNSALLWYELN